MHTVESFQNLVSLNSSLKILGTGSSSPIPPMSLQKYCGEKSVIFDNRGGMKVSYLPECDAILHVREPPFTVFISQRNV
jgi:hypothetical protein